MALMSPAKILDLTISDLLADTSLEFHKQGSILTFSTPDGVISIQLKGLSLKAVALRSLLRVLRLRLPVALRRAAVHHAHTALVPVPQF